MHKILSSIILGTSLILSSCNQPLNPSLTNQQQTQSPIKKQEIEIYEIPTGNYSVVEIVEGKGCLTPKKENDFNLNQGRLLIQKIKHLKPLPQDFEFKIQTLEKEISDSNYFVKDSYGLEPGEYNLWILNQGYKAPFKTLKSEHYMQLTPNYLMNQ